MSFFDTITYFLTTVLESFLGVFVGLINGTIKAFKSIFVARPHIKDKFAKQPAYKTFFLGRGIVGGASYLRYYYISAMSEFKKIDFSKGVPKAVAIAFSYATGSVFAVLISFFACIVIFTFMFMSFILALLVLCGVKAIDNIYLLSKNFYTVCPFCKSKLRLPIYICPKCGERHTKLRPSVYGLFNRKCKCGNMLPCFTTSRKAIQDRICLVCGKTIRTEEAKPFCVPIVGTPYSGKTTYLAGLMNLLTKCNMKKGNLKFKFYDDKSQKKFDSMVQNFNLAIKQVKTIDFYPNAFMFFLENVKKKAKSLFYFYDFAGEAFLDSKYFISQKQYEYANNVIFVIDPFTIKDVRTKFISHPDFKKVVASTQDVNDVFEVFIRNFNLISKRTEDESAEINCAVIINKVDALGLDELLGEKAIDEFYQKNKKSYKKRIDAENALAEKFLCENGMTNFVNGIKHNFSKHKFFLTSTQGVMLGSDVSANSFFARGVAEPFSWLLKNRDKKMARWLAKCEFGKIFASTEQSQNQSETNL